jgi:tellurite resistance protein TehA-like permease
MVSADAISKIVFGVILSILIIIPFYYLAKLMKWPKTKKTLAD